MTGRWQVAALFGLTLLAAAGLKYHYSVASPDDLRWILAPTSTGVGAITGHSFGFEGGVGYVSHEARYIIAAPCAGVNFLIIALCAGVFGLMHTQQTWRRRCTLVVSTAAAAYLATVVINTGRIALAMHLRGVEYGWLTAERIHRLEGIVVYLVCLLGLYTIARHRLEKLACR